LIASAAGRDGSVWVIDRTEADAPNVDVKQFSAARELIRRLALKPEDPQPIAIAAARDADQIFLLEENSAGQRLRALSLLGTAEGAGGAVSDWKVAFEKKITTHHDFGISEGKAVLGGSGAALEKVTVQLPANPLEKGAASRVELAVGYDAGGSFLMTADGLPLQSISETRNLKRVLLAARADKALDVFQDDSAVVEQFRVAKPNEMMAFDCGEIELK
jgi:hypothetical protein